ncbi:hypothetical protein B0H17DRAFT_1077797 [Mycena rosella]|uniref:Uncharacterized protein n=1 Tax=Mycena rosella TaxID=1033263 RepID=A0AAD7D8F5_MYCRO|nr:hypothetical protein B0H17DRAFT_1077797 [Mycena rosella]
MLGMAQSLLAKSLGRVGDPTHAIPPCPLPTPAAFAAHTRLLSWFRPGAPFGVHRMALAGKAVG